jgi:hypothetical protein
MSRIAGGLLLSLGLLQMTGALLDAPLLTGFAAATGASPAPKVFSSVRGLETYSSRFQLEWDDRAGRFHEIEITPALYSRFEGPYNRRNAYGAVVAYGPVLASDPRTELLFAAVARSALCGDAPLLRELAIDDAGRVGPLRLRVEPRPGTRPEGLPLVLEVPCS